MANTFIAKKSDMIDLANISKNQLNRLEDFTKTVCDKTTSVRSSIEAIEAENDGLPLSKRRTYFVYLSGSSEPLHVIHTKISADNICFFTTIINNGTFNMKYDKSDYYGKPRTEAAVQGYITTVAALDSVIAVAFGSFNPDIIDAFKPLDNNKETLIKKLRKEVEKLNSLKASGMIRSYVIEFSKFMKESDVSNADNYKFNIEAYNLYTTMWSTYLLDIEQIINNIKETNNGLSKFKYDIFTENDGIDELPLYQQLIS